MSFQMLEIPLNQKNDTWKGKKSGTSLGLPDAMKRSKIMMCKHTCMRTWMCVDM